MPTKVDAAAEAAHDEISKVVEQIEQVENNLLSPPSDDAVSSPLFRYEVQRQEMRYLDRILIGEKLSAAGNARQPPSEGAAARNQSKEIRLNSGGSKIASILRPYDRKDDEDENKEPTFNNSTRNKQPVNKSPTRSTPTKSSNTMSHKLHQKMSTFINRHNQPKKSKTSSRYHQKRSTRTTAVPSRNKRRQANHKLMQRAQLSSRRVISKMVRLGRRCARNLTTVKNAINHGVAKAVAGAHSMLEETSTHNNAKRRDDEVKIIKENNRKSENVVAIAGSGTTGSKEMTATTVASPRDPSSVRVPPKHAFNFAPSWILGDTKRMSSTAVSVVMRTIHNGRVMKG